RDVPGRQPGLPDHRRVPPLVLTVETVTVPGEPEEVLIADVRGTLTPTQMVERKLLALLRNDGLGVSLQRADGPRDYSGGGNPRAKKAPPRLRARWGVFDGTMKQVAIFDYNQRPAADEKLAGLLAGKKGPHFLQIVKDTMPEPALTEVE